MKHFLDYRYTRESSCHKKHRHVFEGREQDIKEQEEKWLEDFREHIKDIEITVQGDPVTSPDPPTSYSLWARMIAAGYTQRPNPKVISDDE